MKSNCIEIERKFLVLNTTFKDATKHSYSIKQGFLNSDKERTVRVRLKNDDGYLTIKGKSSDNGLSRFEWETQIPKKEAEQLLQLCEPNSITKTRYEIPIGKHIYEVDEFYDDNLGLIVAEIELNSETEDFIKPSWLGKEVTGDVKYYNSQLSKHPYAFWEKNSD